jgi:hypothetical protein
MLCSFVSYVLAFVLSFPILLFICSIMLCLFVSYFLAFFLSFPILLFICSITLCSFVSYFLAFVPSLIFYLFFPCLLKCYVLVPLIGLCFHYSPSYSSTPVPFFQRLTSLGWSEYIWQRGDHLVIITWSFIYYHISFKSRTNCNTGDRRGDCFIYIHLLWKFQARILTRDCFVTTWHTSLNVSRSLIQRYKSWPNNWHRNEN